MQFDPEKHIPTYQFKLGLPGNSFAIEVASQLGLEETLIQRAKELTGNQNVELTDLLKKMTEEKLELSRQNYQFQLKTALLNRKIEEHQQKISHLENETKEIKKQSIREARDFLTSLQKELNREIDNIKKTDKEKRKTLLENSFKKITKMNLDLARTENEFFEEKRIPLKVPKTGQTVWVKDVEMEGEIIEISANNIKVDMNGIFLTTTKDKLFKITSRKSKTAQPKKVTLPVRETKFELKLLGYRFEEALPEIEVFIDKAVMSDLPFVRIVHGKGTGALRSKIRQYLKNNKKVLDFYSPPPQAGGDGVTVVKLEG
ncbi:MAG: Smr/MutS family protein [Candidatus Cloacimonetes bacterium]|nr:Smr/MutS family protein [Candidatus Cloacimonadota bacterium]